MRFAPGYFSDARELDPQYAATARAELATKAQQDSSVVTLAQRVLTGWTHGDLGRSRQFDVPVTELVRARAATSVRLLLSATFLGWTLACVVALALGLRRHRASDAWTEPLITAPAAILLAIPAGALATLCLVANIGGALLVLALTVAVRDFKLIYRLLRRTSSSPHLLYARSLGLPVHRIVLSHLLPSLAPDLLGLAIMSFVLALSALVPIEVIFDVPGLGQLAWSAAMNRDLPVLLGVTLFMALAVGIASFFTNAGSAISGSELTNESQDRALLQESA